MMKSKNISPDKDTGWGVIFRLNGLFNEIEDLAPAGRYDDWNFKLDRIWSNLVYRNPLTWIKNAEGKIIDYKFNESDIEEKEFLDKQILKAKALMNHYKKNSKNEEDYQRNKEWLGAKKGLYRAIQVKEIWLRKFMHTLGLYLKEVEHNPAGAMWGSTK